MTPAKLAMKEHLESVSGFYRQQAMRKQKVSLAYVIWVDFEVPDAEREIFLSLVKANAALSVQLEPDCQRFDVLEPVDGTSSIALYEITTAQMLLNSISAPRISRTLIPAPHHWLRGRPCAPLA